jgi:hypothetical protein
MSYFEWLDLGWKYYVGFISFHVASRLDAYPLLRQLVYIMWLAVEVIFIYFFLIETRNRSLDECAVWVVVHSCGSILIFCSSCRLFDGNSVMFQMADLDSMVVERAEKVQANEAGSQEEKFSWI